MDGRLRRRRRERLRTFNVEALPPNTPSVSGSLSREGLELESGEEDERSPDRIEPDSTTKPSPSSDDGSSVKRKRKRTSMVE